ncbi:MAG: S-methyl-5'-thioinosine phosphorylase [Sphingomonas sp.]|nr:MAG: S-methyl-5'-thioinosine phosphorylase [Sphingomonas sp.]
MKLGIIGGSGLYALPQLEAVHRHAQETPWGWPSDVLVEGVIADLPVVFLPRHGPHHAIAPHEINYRANIAALKAIGCTAVVSVAACGSFTDDLPPGTLAVPHQIVDRTQGRADSFFGGGLVAHVSLADPIATELADAILAAATGIGAPAKGGGTYLAVQGPRFATRAESRLAKAQGLDIVGMTAMPEAALAREAEMAYAIAAFVTDFDGWKEEAVTTSAVLEVMAANRTRSQMLVAALCAELARRPLPQPSREGWETALDQAIVTPRNAWPTGAAAHLRAIAPRLFS